MALVEEVAERLGGTGVVGAGVAAVLLVPIVAKPFGKGLRVLCKGAIKAYLIGGAWLTRTQSNMVAGMHTMMSEARAESNGSVTQPAEGEEGAQASVSPRTSGGRRTVAEPVAAG